MTARDIQNYMIRNGACPSDIYCDVVNGIVYFDTREVPAKAYCATIRANVNEIHIR